MIKTPLPLKMLLKAMFMLSSPALLVLSVLVMVDLLALSHFLLSYVFILLGSCVFAYPFLANISSLTQYVHDLAAEKKITAPDLNFLSMVVELSAALSRLQNIWEAKRNQMESIITEREILVDTLPDILIMINDQRQIVRTNRAARAIFGQSLAGRTLGEVVPSDTLVEVVTSVIEDCKGREVEFRMEDPVLRDFLAVIERFPIQAHQGMSVIITMNDITELKSVEQMRADFVANASHEIRTPLATISGMIETLQGPAKDDAQAREDFLAIMSEQADRMKQLINDLLSLSKIEMNAHSVPMEPADLVKVVRSVARQLEHHASGREMRINLDVHPDLPLVRGEENELAQVAHNLIGNAVKYGAQGSDINVVLRITSDLPADANMRNISRVMLMQVRDQGEGIAREHLSRLMERFYRVDSARTRTIGGTGLGLAIVKGIVSHHRGAITVDSVVGKGSVFSVYLPLYDSGE